MPIFAALFAAMAAIKLPPTAIGAAITLPATPTPAYIITSL